MGTNNPHASAQLSLTFEQGIGQRHMSLRDCMATGVYQRGLGRVAGQIDMAGDDAEAACYIAADVNQNKVWGAGIAGSTTRASINAITSAVNRALA